MGRAWVVSLFLSSIKFVVPLQVLLEGTFWPVVNDTTERLPYCFQEAAF